MCFRVVAGVFCAGQSGAMCSLEHSVAVLQGSVALMCMNEVLFKRRPVLTSHACFLLPVA